MIPPECAARLEIVKRLAVGVELAGDLRAPLEEAEATRLRELLRDERLLVFRRQRLTHDQQIHTLSALGPILRSADGVGYISIDKSKGGLGTTELAFHSDLAFTADPFWAISLHAIDVEDGASSTRFADGVRAYEGLPEAMRARIADWQVTSVMPVDMGTDRLGEDIPFGMPHCTRPAVLRHPRSGRPVLYVSQQQAVRIEGLECEASAAALRELFAAAYRPEYVYEHRWYSGDLVIWDNLALQHARGELPAGGRRTLQRVVVAERSFFELCPQVRMDDPEYLQWINSSDPKGDRHLIERVVARHARVG